MDMMDMMKRHMARLADKLDLSEEQQDKLKALHISYKKDMIRRNADREIAQIDLDELIQQEETDLNAVEMQIRKIADLEAATKYSWIKLWTDAKSLLTAEQRAAFKKLMKEQKGSMMGQMKVRKKAKIDKPGPKRESGEHLEHHK
jgi:Spy/CpxP family protein refolding chaperone